MQLAAHFLCWYPNKHRVCLTGISVPTLHLLMPLFSNLFQVISYLNLMPIYTHLLFSALHSKTSFTSSHTISETNKSIMASSLLFKLALFVSLIHFSSEARILAESDQIQQMLSFQYHNGPLLAGKISINLIWYGNFKPAQRAIVSDFITSLSSTQTTVTAQPSVATWWKGTEKYYNLIKSKKTSSLVLSLGTQVLDESYSLGKSLSNKQIVELASKGSQSNAINVVLTSADVAVDGFCSSRCGTHGSAVGANINGKRSKFAYIWVGNSETQCPGQCAWPFHQPIYGPQTPPLVAPNNDVGLDGMVINLAGTVTNPFGNGYFQGPKEAPLEAASACPGVYGKGAYPGYAGVLLVDATSGASYNAHGVNGRKYLVPALFDPSTSACSTLV